MRPIIIWVPRKFAGLPDYAHGYFSQNFMGFYSDDTVRKSAGEFLSPSAMGGGGAKVASTPREGQSGSCGPRYSERCRSITHYSAYHTQQWQLYYQTVVKHGIISSSPKHKLSIPQLSIKPLSRVGGPSGNEGTNRKAEIWAMTF